MLKQIYINPPQNLVDDIPLSLTHIYGNIPFETCTILVLNQENLGKQPDFEIEN